MGPYRCPRRWENPAASFENLLVFSQFAFDPERSSTPIVTPLSWVELPPHLAGPVGGRKPPTRWQSKVWLDVVLRGNQSCSERRNEGIITDFHQD